MFKIAIAFGISQVTLSLDSNDGNQPAELQYEGGERQINFVRQFLQQSTGAFGHVMNADVTNPIDLHAALFTTEGVDRFSPQVLEGAELVKNYNANIPEDAVT